MFLSGVVGLSQQLGGVCVSCQSWKSELEVSLRRGTYSISTPGTALTHSACLQQFLFINEKVKSLYHQRKRPAKIAWTAQYRKAHRKVRSCILT